MSTSRLRILPALFKIMLVSSDLWLHLLRFFSWASLSDPCCTNFQLESAALKKSFTVQEQSNLPLRSSNASEDEGYRVLGWQLLKIAYSMFPAGDCPQMTHIWGATAGFQKKPQNLSLTALPTGPHFED